MVLSERSEEKMDAILAMQKLALGSVKSGLDLRGFTFSSPRVKMLSGLSVWVINKLWCVCSKRNSCNIG